MSLDPISAGLDFAGKLVDRFIPDPQAKLVAQGELAKMAATGELARLAAETDLAKGQLAINEAEAASGSLFTAGWRPLVGWFCAAGVGQQFVLGPYLTWFASLSGHALPFPALDNGTLMPLLLTLLGVAGLRSFDKLKGTAK